MLAISAVGWLPVAAQQEEISRLWVITDVVLGAATYVLVFYRRRWPVPVAVVIALVSAVSGTASGPAVLAAGSVCNPRRWREIAPVGALCLASSQFFSIVLPNGDSPGWVPLAVNVVATAALVSWGMYVGSRRELIWTLRTRAEQAEAEQELRLGQARGTERARIAREMHDVLAHRISQISLHAGALAFRDGLSAEQMRASAGVIQEKAHEALTDLRGVLVV